MMKFTNSTFLIKIGALLLMLLSFGSISMAQNNIAPLASVTANGSNGGGCFGGCNTLNDLDIGFCGTQQMYINTNNPPLTSAGDDYIEWNFPSIHAIDSLIIHHGEAANRSLTGATVQYWDGSWITHTTFDSLPQQCENKIYIGNLETDRLRLTSLKMTGSGQTSNPNFREIEIIENAYGSNNGAVTRLDSPAAFCGTSTQDIYATIKNLGTNVIDSIDVFWEVDGVSQGSKKIITLLDTIEGINKSDTTIKLGSYNFTTLSKVKVYTSMPNGKADTVNYNDTLIAVVGPGLSGNYTVDPNQAVSATNFTSLDSMANLLNTLGVCGSVRINVASGVYNTPLYLKDIPGVSAANNILIDGGDSSQTIVSHDGSKYFATLTLDGTKFTRIQNFTFKMTGDENSAVIFSGNVAYDTLSNSSTWLDTNLTTDHWNIAFSASPNSIDVGATANNIVVQNNRIIGGVGGVKSTGGMTLANSRLQFYNNEIDSTYDYGFYLYFHDSLEVVGNSINMLSRGNADADAILSFFGNNAHFNRNYIWAGNYGIRVFNFPFQTPTAVSRPFEVINNMIYTENNNALSLDYVDSLALLHNSVNTTSTTESAVKIVAGAVGPVDGYDVRNNIFKSAETVTFEISEPDSVFAKFDNNIFYKVKSTGGLIDINDTTFANLSDYQSVFSNSNGLSLEGDPQFISNTDLHVAGLLPNEAGDPSTGVAIDIDGDSRPSLGSSIVDIGADEFPTYSCPPPNTSIDSIRKTSAIAYFTPSTLGNDIQYVLVPCGLPKASGDTMITSTDSVLFTGLNASTCYDFYIREVCSRGDTTVWAGPYGFNTLIQEPTGITCINGGSDNILVEEFDALTNNGWVGDIGSGSSGAKWNVNSGTTITSETGPNAAHSGNNYAYVETTGKANETARIVSPMIDLSEVSDSAELSFWMHAYGASLGTIEVGISDSATGPFNKIFTWSGAYQTNQSDPFKQVGLRLDNYVGDSIFIEFAYNFKAGGKGDLAIDLMEIKGCVSCPKPDSLSANVYVTSADLVWVEKAAASNWEYSYGNANFSPNQGTKNISSTTNVNISNLTKGTAYEFYVRSICGAGDTSAWAGPFAFRTLETLPFMEDFETFGNITSNPWPKGWSSTTVSNPKWESDSGSTTSGSTGPDVDHTLGTSSGIYTYLETSGGDDGDSADFVSPSIYVANNQTTLTLSFWYHFYGATVNGMDVIIDTNGVENIVDTIYGQRQTASSDPWIKDSIVLSGYEGKAITLKFRGKRGSSFTGDIAIDDVMISASGSTSTAYYPIATLNTSNANGEADSLNVEAWTSGMVVGVDLNAGNGLGFALIDDSTGTQEGIYVYSSNDVGGYSVNEGDSLKVKGTVDQFNGLTQFVVDSIEVISTGNSIPTARIVSKLDESTESQWLEMEKFVLLDSSQTGSYNMLAHNGSDTIMVRVNDQTDVSDSLADARNTLSVGDTICMMKGIGGQFDTSSTAPYLSGYQITPMYYSDLTICKDITIGISDKTASNKLRFYPNPTTGSFTIATSGLENDNALITIRDISGKVIVREQIMNSSSAFKKHYTLEGQAKGLYLISIIDGENRINKKLILQ